MRNQVSPPGPAAPVWGLTHEGVASWSFQMLHLLWTHPFSCRPCGRTLDAGRKAYFWRQDSGARARMTPARPALRLGQERRSETPDLAAGRIGLCCQAGLSTEGWPPALSQA